MQRFAHPKNLIWIKIAFSGQHWTGPSIEKCEKNSGVIKRSISGMNQSKNQQIMKYSPLQFILFKMSINNHLKWKISTKIFFVQQAVIPGLEPILYAGKKLWLTAKFFRKLYLEASGKQLEKLVFLENLLENLLAFITFVNYEHPYLAEKFLHIFFSQFVFGKKEKRSKKKVCWNSSCLQSVTRLQFMYCKIKNQRTSCSEYTFP